MYIKLGTEFGSAAIRSCLHSQFLNEPVSEKEIDAMIVVSSSGMATPSLDARMMNQLPFSIHTKRIPIWGLGCAGGAAGLSRAYEYCRAFPEENVLVVCIELCSLTFQRNDHSKSNLIGTSLFADGVSCTLVSGEHSALLKRVAKPVRPVVKAVHSTLMPNSEEVMGWEVKDSGLHVVFSKSIPAVVEKWLKPNVEQFLQGQGLELGQVDAFIAHPGGKKRYWKLTKRPCHCRRKKTEQSRKVLRANGNMSSPTVMYVLKQFMEQRREPGDYGLVTALGPGFCSELALLQWEAIH